MAQLVGPMGIWYQVGLQHIMLFGPQPSLCMVHCCKKNTMVQVSVEAAPGDCDAYTHLLLVFLFSFFLPLFVSIERINHILYLTLPALLFPSEKVRLIVVLDSFCLIIVIVNQQLTGKLSFYLPSFLLPLSCAKKPFWLIVRRLWTFFDVRR